MRASTKIPLIVFCGVTAACGEIIDRVAVSVGNRVITTSDIERQIRVSAFLSGTKPDLSPAARRKTAESMVDQWLVRRELETARYPEPAPADLDAAFAEFRRKFYKADDEYRRALSEYGITESDVKEQLHWQRTWMSFIGVRFRSGADIGANDIEDYFSKTVAPAARLANPSVEPNLDNFRDQIATKLAGDREDRLMEQWLSDARHAVDITYHEEAFR